MGAIDASKYPIPIVLTLCESGQFRRKKTRGAKGYVKSLWAENGNKEVLTSYYHKGFLRCLFLLIV
jgi:hypothetical protein